MTTTQRPRVGDDETKRAEGRPERRCSVYIAASAAEIPRVRAMESMLRAAGFAIASTWPANVEAVGNSNPRGASAEQRRAWSVADFAELASANVVCFLAPTTSTRGAWAELGYAYGIHKPILCVGDTKQSIFCALGHEVAGDAEAVAWLVERVAEGL